MPAHLYKCDTCNEEVDVKFKLGQTSDIPDCPNQKFEKLLGPEHTMKRKWQIGGAYVKW